MTDVLKMCDVIENCTECPRYGDDCDGMGDAEMQTIAKTPDYMQHSRHDDGRMTREEAIEQIKWYFEEDDGISAEDITKEAVGMAIEALSADPNKAVSPSLADVYKWERDIALSQLEEYGIGFAEKKRDDLVEVVRCKDCKHWQKTNIETIDGEPTYDCPFCGEWADANGFCSFGERKEP